MHDVHVSCRPDLIFLFETHTVFQGTSHFWNREGYDVVAVEEVQGHSGGVWALSRQGCGFRYQVEEQMPQCISVHISKGSQHWICSGVYASPTFHTRGQLWQYLRDLRGRIHAPWALVGDFNDILLPSEQPGGVFSRMRAEAFAGVLEDCALMDLGFIGGKFTWQRKCRGGMLVSRRLDRGLGDHNWRLKFPEGVVEHLMKRHSDHNPLLLWCYLREQWRGACPFRFQAAWCVHEGYKNVVRNAWERGVV